MSAVIPQYPFDPTGLAESNKVVEVVAIKSRGILDHYYIVPRVSPFYAESVKLRLYPPGTNPNNPAQGMALEEGIHYNFGYRFSHASHTIGKPVYGAISFYDRTLEGQLRVEVQTLGGEWVLDDKALSELLLNYIRNPRTTTWEQLVELPHQFPVVNHDFSVDDFVGMSEVVDELSEIEKAILLANAGGLNDHINDRSNPHEVTKAQVGLSLVDNYPSATPAEASAGTANNRFMTPLRVKQAIDALALTALTTHTNNTNNPHGVTKAQVGLSSVQNLALATQAEAEAGASHARYMTPLRTRESIEAIVGGAFNAHAANRSNPHQVTKAQVGLGSVPNLGIATDGAALQGLDDSGLMTPRLVSMVMNEVVGAVMNSHLFDTNNPHNVTKAQIGLGSVADYPPASEAEARDGTAINRYMTPLAVRQAINELVGDMSNAHASARDNPHQVTKAQVGLSSVLNYGLATEAESTAGTSNAKYMTPLRTKQAIDFIAGATLDLHKNDTSNPHAVTKTQVGLGNVDDYPTASMSDAQAGVASDRFMTPLATAQAIEALVGDLSSAHASNLNNPHQVTKAQVGLGSVQNYAVATEAESGAGTSNVKYMTPLRVKQAIDVLAAALVNAHANQTNNPHSVTKAQVGLGNVDDYPTASQAEATAGTAGNRFMTPQRVKEAIDAQVGGAYNTHAAARNNPHAVTKAQVSLGSVENYGIATEAESVAGTSNVKYMTPLRVKQAIADQAGTLVNTHANQTNNPHAVTKAQVGLGSVENYGIASEAEAIAATVNDKYMTPLAVRRTINALVGDQSNAHVSDHNNPHEVTKAQVGLGSVGNYGIATQGEAEVGSSNVKYMTPLRVKQAIDELAISAIDAHAALRNNPHAVTAAQVGAYTQAQVNNLLNGKLGTTATAADSAQVFGMNQQALQTWIATLSTANAANIGGMTPEQFTEIVLQGKAADSDKLDGRSFNDVVQHVSSAIGSQVSGVMEIPASYERWDEASSGMVPIGQHWVEVGHIPYNDASVSLLLSGGLAEGGTKQHTMMLNMALTGTGLVGGSVEIRHLSNASTSIRLGYVDANGRVTLYVHSMAGRGDVAILELTPGRFVLFEDDPDAGTFLGDPVFVAPAGIVYPTPKAAYELVDDFATATQAEATSGTANNRFMTPLRVKQAIDALATGAITSHTNNTNNPHSVTKSQVGLGSVQNYPVASSATTIAGSVSNQYVVPSGAKALVDNEMGLLCDALIDVIDDAIAALG